MSCESKFRSQLCVCLAVTDPAKTFLVEIGSFLTYLMFFLAGTFAAVLMSSIVSYAVYSGRNVGKLLGVKIGAGYARTR